MITDDLEALVLADAVGAIDAAEKRDLEARLAALPADDMRTVERLYESVLGLASSVDLVDPPPRVRERLMASLREPTRYVIDAEAEWGESGLPGVRAKVLAVDRARGLVTMLLRAQPGATYPAHHHTAPEECYVISGSIEQGGRVMRAGDFVHADADSDHEAITTSEGAEVLVVGAIADYLPQLL
jgi:quercetin dioxygenase-like cupin family protein